MNRRSLLLGAIAASACGAGLVPAAVAAQPAPMSYPRNLLRPFWKAARVHWDASRMGGLGGTFTNEQVRASLRAFMAENGMAFPMVFPGHTPETAFTIIGLRERRRDDGVLELGVLVHSDDIVFLPEQSGTHFEPINMEYPRA